MDNLNYIFNKGYFQTFYDEGYHDLNSLERLKKKKMCFKQANQQIINFKLDKNNVKYNDLMPKQKEYYEPEREYYELKYEVLYPGLVIGTGNVHEAQVKEKTDGLSKEEKRKVEKSESEAQAELIKLGFTFDYVTGLPYLPGSSVKGILRSAFEGEKHEMVRCFLSESKLFSTDQEISEKAEEIIAEKEKEAPLTEERDDLLKKEQNRLKKEELILVENAIFGESVKDNVHAAHEDIFLDAIIESGATDHRTIKNGNLLDYEYITSHLADDPNYQGLTAPNPVRLLKIRPRVKIKFRFILSDTKVENKEMDKTITIDKAAKLKLFRDIIELFGVGAKTNVGYGQLKFNE